MASESRHPSPETLGKYRVIRRLGAGGMAEVFLARSTGAEGIEKILVVKRILPTFARNAKFLTMFLEEAKIATRLNHPNIVQVYAFEQVRDEFLLAMEFVDGVDLGRLVGALKRSRRAMPYSMAAYIVMEVAKGLDYAHKRKDERGQPMEIVHRDVSPQNVLLSYEGTVKIADFGIAKARIVSEHTGVIKGKFSYMSPEQARGERVDRRCDVYSLGVLLAELLTGRPMYQGIHGLDVLERVRQGEITLPREIEPNVPKELHDIARRATEFDREDRYPTCRALAGVLSQYLHSQEEVHDAEVLESLIAELVPREVTSPEAVPVRLEHAVSTAATVASAQVDAGRVLRERRHVVLVSGVVRSPGEQAPIKSVGHQAVGVLADIAFKSDAVLSWPEGAGRNRFRFTLGLRRASVHDPLGATRLALDVLDALQGLSADLVVPITASIGVSRGVVSTVRDRDGRLQRYEPVGSVVEVADRLGEVGEPGEVLETGEVYRLVRRTFAFDDDGTREIVLTTDHGRERKAVRAYRLRGARTREERAGDLSLTGQQGLVGRGEETGSISETYQEVVATGASAGLVVTGELGVGKTALVALALEALHPRPRILRTECTFGMTDAPFAAVSELIREAAGVVANTSRDQVRERLHQLATELSSVEEERQALLAGLEPLLAPLSSGSEVGEEGDDNFPQIAHAVRALLHGLAAERSLVVWVDALQWADTSSLELMSSLAQQSKSVPLMVLLSTRPDPRIDPVLSAIPRMEVQELAEDERRQLIRVRFDGAEVPADVQRAIVERAGGNPFFITELVEALIDRRVVTVEGRGDKRRVVRKPGAPIALPTTLEGVIAARLDELPEDERHAVRWLAVVGPGLRGTILAKLAGKDLSDSFEALERRGLVQRRTDGVWAFPSAVIRHVAYETTDENDRKHMHRRIGSHLATMGVAVPPARIARHLERAGDEAAAAHAYFNAAAAAYAVHWNREALRFYGRALSLLPSDSKRRFEAHEAREQILRGMGRQAERRLELQAMRAQAEQAGDAGMRAVAHNGLARYELDQSRTAGVGALLRVALASAIESSERAAEVEALRLTAQLGRFEGDVQGALERCDQALARVGYDRDMLAARGSVLNERSHLLRYTGRLGEALEASVEAAVIFRRLDIKRSEAYALNSLGVVLAAMGEWEDATTVIRKSITMDREIGDRMYLGRKLSNVGQLYADLGDSDRALEFLERALDVFEATDDPTGSSDALSAVAEVLLEDGDQEKAAGNKLDQALLLARRTGDLYDQARERIVRSALEVQMGRLDEAESCAREAVALARDAGIVGYEMLALASLAETLARLGRHEDAREMAEGVRDRLLQKDGVERAERVFVAVAGAFALAGAEDEAKEVLAEAVSLVDSRLKGIRDEELRTHYTSSPTVQRIRSSAA